MNYSGMETREWLEHCAINPDRFYEAFGESEWVNQVCYVWKPNVQLLTQVQRTVEAKNSPIIPVGGMYGAGKSAFKWALQSLLEEKGTIKVISTRLHFKTSGFNLCTQVADTMGLRELFGKRYPRSRQEVLAVMEKKLKELLLQLRPVMIIDDAHFMDAESYLTVKSICDFEIDGKRICPVILLGEYATIDENLKNGILAQVRERAQFKGVINAFTEVDGFEMIARGLSYAKNDPIGIDYDIESNQADGMRRCEPFNAAAVGRILALTRLPRQIKQLVVRSVETQAEKADDLGQNDKYILTPNIINEVYESLGWSK